MKASIWIRILAPMRSPDDPIVKDVNYEHMPPHWAPAQVWFAKRQRDHTGDLRSLVQNRAQYIADNAILMPAIDTETPKQYNADWILLSKSVAQTPVHNILQSDIDLDEVGTPRTPPSIQDSDSASKAS